MAPTPQDLCLHRQGIQNLPFFMRSSSPPSTSPSSLAGLTALLSEVGLNIQEAHVYSTTDGFCLDVFVVDGWKTEETEALIATIEDTLMRKNGAPPNSANASSSEKILELREQLVDCEIDWNILAVAEKITSGSSADLYRGTHSGLDVCIKILRSAHHNSPSEVEFLQQALMLRRVKHENILTFYGACTKHRKYCAIVTVQNHCHARMHLRYQLLHCCDCFMNLCLLFGL
uniref:Serine-threonine/tyrosine-protein kinase catalytic domain-containing protein n=1 Tax=Aegilops tauschii subsp. strangulata TaxID=200361 RepID=A0A453S4N6_AEGTS